ncbi:MAG: 30S ribosomal protein S6 [Clostridiales bacterium]|nr:30S ribosomal protein S6 [Clostridiales bacterium]
MAEKLIYSYETIFIIDAGLEEDAVKALTEKFTNLISNNGTLESVEEWGKRRFAYEIDDKTEGYYVLADFTSDGDFPKELDRQYRITDGIVRTIIIRKDK